MGKLPAGKEYRDGEQVLGQVPVPADDGEENCITWVKAALRVLQHQPSPAWAEAFDVDKFMDDAYQQMKKWEPEVGDARKDNKASHVNRSFP